MASTKNRLVTIPISHYCEKARWALERAQVPYVEERHLQGFHYLSSYRAARSRTVPVLETPGQVLTDSTDIIKWCDSRASRTRKMRPVHTAEQAHADRLEDYFDQQLGVAGRLWMYTYLLRDIPLVLKYARLHGVPWHEIALLPVVFPLIRGRIHRGLDLTSTSRADTKAIVDRAFDDVANWLSGKRFLVADCFTSADLTFAALSAPVLMPENYGVRLPGLEELPQDMARQIERWREHPAGQFGLRMYREFRDATHSS